MAKLDGREAQREDEAVPASGPREGLWPTRGTLWDITSDGRVLCVWRGGPPRPVSISGMSHDRVLAGIRARKDVLISFLDGDPLQPVVTGDLHERIEADAATAGAREPVVEIVAREELVLRCGESALVLRADGRIELRGSDVEAISSGAVHLRGAYVGLN